MTAPRILLDARKARDFGIGRYIVGLLGGLSRQGGFSLSALARAADVRLLPESVTPIVSEAPHYSLGELVSVRAAIRRVSPDLFHAPHYVVPLDPPHATVVTVHDLMHLTRPEHASPAKRTYASVMMRRAVRLSARLIAGSEATRRDLVAFEPEAAGKCTVISYGLDERFFAAVPDAERDRVLTRHGLTPGYVLFLGNDKPHKNVEGLLDALASSKNRALRLVLAGGAPERTPARREAAVARGLGASVFDLGIVPDDEVPALLHSAGVLVLPSFTEGFGLPALEAQAVGTPVVCSDRGGLREAAGDAALYVDPESPASIAEAIEKALSDPVLRERLSREGRDRARSFTWERVASETAALYRSVLG